MMTILVTGGAGFIGSAVVRHLVSTGRYRIVNLDKLTYAGNLASLKPVEVGARYSFYKADIADFEAVSAIMRRERIDSILHLAAESHVDRSIDAPMTFLETNVVGTVRLISAALSYWRELPQASRDAFRFHHVSTDEVYGDLPMDAGIFTEDSPYQPSSPYSASKAASDHFVRAWHKTYGLPIVQSNCSNNYGPYHFPEKLIPLAITNALDGMEIPIYGNGTNVRDWLYVEDHARALEAVLTRGIVGRSYNIGGRSERSNIAVIQLVCQILDEKRPRGGGSSYRDLITFVTDRPGHDRRYAIDPARIENELGWSPAESFESGLLKTVCWFLDNEWWWRPLRDQRFDGRRQGLSL